MMILDLSNPRTVDEKVANIIGVKLMPLVIWVNGIVKLELID